MTLFNQCARLRISTSQGRNVGQSLYSSCMISRFSQECASLGVQLEFISLVFYLLSIWFWSVTRKYDPYRAHAHTCNSHWISLSWHDCLTLSIVYRPCMASSTFLCALTNSCYKLFGKFFSELRYATKLCLIIVVRAETFVFTLITFQWIFGSMGFQSSRKYCFV